MTFIKPMGIAVVFIIVVALHLLFGKALSIKVSSDLGLLKVKFNVGLRKSNAGRVETDHYGLKYMMTGRGKSQRVKGKDFNPG